MKAGSGRSGKAFPHRRDAARAFAWVFQISAGHSPQIHLCCLKKKTSREHETGHRPDAGTHYLFIRTDLHSRVHRMSMAFPPPLQTALVAGTIVLTADGAIPVEFLEQGDRIITRNTGLVCLSGIGFHRRAGDFISIAAGTLGRQMPQTDTVVACDQPILLRGPLAFAASGQSSCLMPAGDLPRACPGLPGLALFPGIDMAMVQLQFDSAQIVYADGLETLCAPLTAAVLAA